MVRRLLATVIAVASLTFTTSAAPKAVRTEGSAAQVQHQNNAQTTSPRRATFSRPDNTSTTRTQVLLAKEIGHELATLPFYDVFDWLDGQVMPDGSVQLRGQVVRPTTKTDAERRVRDIEGITRVDDQIEVLPVSPNDDRLRIAIYRALFNFDSPLFTRYGTRAVPPIHIIVKNGRATLKGVVANQLDNQLAYTFARQVPGLFDVANELRVESARGR